MTARIVAARRSAAIFIVCPDLQAMLSSAWADITGALSGDLSDVGKFFDLF